MTAARTDFDILRFGVFELDRRRSELWKAGFAVKLAPQPFKVSESWAARPGELVSRDDLRREVWSDETLFDFDRSLHVCNHAAPIGAKRLGGVGAIHADVFAAEISIFSGGGGSGFGGCCG